METDNNSKKVYTNKIIQLFLYLGENEMNRKSLNIFIFLFISILLSINVFAQLSDYEIVENFKKACLEITSEINSCDTNEKLEYVTKKVAALQENYKVHEKLLNNTLYPDNFVSAIKTLNNKCSVALEKISLQKNLNKTLKEKQTLFAELEEVNSRVESLSVENSDLSDKIKVLRSRSKKDKENNKKIKNLLAKLKENIKNKDNLVASMINNLFHDFQKPDLSDEKKESMVKMIDMNFFKTIQNSISDNISFLESNELLPEDLEHSEEQYKKFTDLWNKVSSDLVNTYLNDEDRKKMVTKIATSVNTWKQKIAESSWDNIYNLFEQNKLSLSSFSSAEEFKASLFQMIDEMKDKGEKEQFDLFVNEVWKKDLGRSWLPYLLAKNKISKDQVAEIKAKIDEETGNPYTYYGGIAFLVLIVFLIGSIIIKSKKEETVG